MPDNRYREYRITVTKQTADQLKAVAKEEGKSEHALLQEIILLGAQQLRSIKEMGKEQAL